jgi:hypothetical protein
MSNNHHLAPRTIREWLELIPFDRARKEAIEVYYKSHCNNSAPKLKNKLSTALYVMLWGTSYEMLGLYWTIKRMEASVKLKQQQDAPEL